jgi:DNA-binding MarR family transcriptional regulator
VEQQRRALLSETLHTIGLNLTQWIALCTLVGAGACSMTELAQASAIDRTSLTRTIDSLIPRNLVARYTPSNNRRSVMVEATAEGRGLIEGMSKEIEVLEAHWFRGFTGEELDRLTHDLGKLLADLPADRKTSRSG